MRIGWIGVIPAFVGGVMAVGVAIAPVSTAQPQVCTTLTTASTKCESNGNVEIDDSLSRSNTLPQWSAIGGQSGGPYGGNFGGGTR